MNSYTVEIILYSLKIVGQPTNIFMEKNLKTK